MEVTFFAVLISGALLSLSYFIFDLRQPGKHNEQIERGDSPNQISELFNTLWRMDTNARTHDKHYKVNLQGSIRKNNAWKDQTEAPLFTWLDEEALKSLNTYKSFMKLLDKYEAKVGICEIYSDEKKRDIWNLVDDIYNTTVMQVTYRYLIRKGLVSADEGAFKKHLHEIWFTLYSRAFKGECPDSSAFEHVFIGEKRGPKVIGFHNWLRFYELERTGRINYFGHYSIHKKEDNSEPMVVVLKFSWDDQSEKEFSSMFLGTSPEFEFALYTAAFLTLVSENKETVTISPSRKIKCFTLHNTNRMGTCYIVVP